MSGSSVVSFKFEVLDYDLLKKCRRFLRFFCFLSDFSNQISPAARNGATIAKIPMPFNRPDKTIGPSVASAPPTADRNKNSQTNKVICKKDFIFLDILVTGIPFHHVLASSVVSHHLATATNSMNSGNSARALPGTSGHISANSVSSLESASLFQCFRSGPVGKQSASLSSATSQCDASPCTQLGSAYRRHICLQHSTIATKSSASSASISAATNLFSTGTGSASKTVMISLFPSSVVSLSFNHQLAQNSFCHASNSQSALAYQAKQTTSLGVFVFYSAGNDQNRTLRPKPVLQLRTCQQQDCNLQYKQSQYLGSYQAETNQNLSNNACLSGYPKNLLYSFCPHIVLSPNVWNTIMGF